jgi:hypothetical protein
MTREEAIEQLNFMIETIPKEPSAECDSIKEWLDTDKDIRNALEMAALEFIRKHRNKIYGINGVTGGPFSHFEIIDILRRK